MDRLESMTVLAAVVDAGSFSGAGRALRMPVATVSRKVAELEAHLKVRLLRRSTRRLSLTDTGQTYLASCRQILEQVSAAERAAAGEFQTPRGELRLTAPIVLGRLHVLPVVCAFLAEFSDVDIHLLLDDRNVASDKPIDLSVRVGKLPDSQMMAVKIGEVRPVVCASPGYLRRHGTPRTPEDLASHRSVGFGALSGSDWTFRTARGPRTVSLRPRLLVNTAEAALDAAVEGVGVTRVLSYQLAPLESARRLVRILRDAEPAPLPVHLLYAGSQPLPLKLRAFLDYAGPRLRQRLALRRPAPRAA